MLQGNWREAAGYNVLLIAVVAERLVCLLLPVFGVGKYNSNGARYYKLLFISALLFGILRNIPAELFHWMAP
jgi:hypothetical protein